MKKVQLLPEQLEIIKRRKATLEVQIKEIHECLLTGDSKLVSSSDRQGFDGIPDLASFQELSRLRNELSELNETIRNAEIVEAYDYEKIEVGTRFIVTLKKKNQMVTSKHILVDGVEHILELLSSEYKPVSINSPFGQAVRSKKANEVITYVSMDAGLVMGLIDTIIPVNEKNISENGHQLTKQKDEN